MLRTRRYKPALIAVIRSVAEVCRQSFSIGDIYTMITTNATKRIVVREEAGAYLSGMREPGMTSPESIEGMIEREKKRRLVEDIKRIQETEDLVEIPFCSDSPEFL